MEKIRGRSVFGGIAIGKIFVYRKSDQKINKITVKDTKTEVERFNKAVETAKEELTELYNRSLENVGKDNAAIFEMHKMMLDDIDFVEGSVKMIEEEKVNAEYAVQHGCELFAEELESIDDDYMSARASDVRDVFKRVIDILLGNTKNQNVLEEPCIILAQDLMPSETIQLDKSKVLSFVTHWGSTNSHTAILARSMNIPALIGVDFKEEFNGKQAIVDGYEGLIIVDPDDQTIEKYNEIKKEYEEKAHLLESLKGAESVTLDGKHIKLYANLADVNNVKSVLENDAEGIGLLRSEMIFLESDNFPSEEEQFKAYKSVVEVMGDKQVIIRTLDIGADKQVSYFNLPKEENPALGYRAIRICLQDVDLFKTQLRAILRASAYGNVGIMYPMIISVDEVVKIKEIVSEVKADLDNEGIPYGQIEQGIMIETPASVLISEELANQVDFFSIGTNDLTQYLLALDRQNPRLDAFFNAHHPAVLKAIRLTIENAHKGGAWVGICGELGADLSLTDEFIKMGVDELSVTPSRVLAVKEKIRNCTFKKR